MSSLTPGKIITFYSYKGGTGRSMALANVAWILASNGKQVLVVDWDLEAPGLHRYFRPFLVDADLKASHGIIDLMWEFATEAMTPPASPEDPPPDWYHKHANILRYATSLEWNFPSGGTLDFVPAGRQGPAYAKRVNSFNWQNFYDRLGGGTFIEAVKDSMRSEYDYILIDSRTGVSDTAGICTVQMPDTLVVCFTLNNQSINGAAAVAESVCSQRQGNPLRLLPVPMRVEDGEKNKLDVGRKYAWAKFAPFVESMAPGNRDSYWLDVEVPYRVFYAYEEVLATFGDLPDDVQSILAATERLTSNITGGDVIKLQPIPEAERLRVKAEFERIQPDLNSGLTPETAPLRPDQQASGISPAVYAYDAFISYRRQPPDQEFARQLLQDLEAAGYRVAIDVRDFRLGVPILEELERCIRQSRFTLLVASPRYFQSSIAEIEPVILQVLDIAERQRRLIPLVQQQAEFPTWLKLITGIDFTDERPLVPPLEKLKQALGQPATDTPPKPPTIWHVPHSRNPFFTGREKTLTRIRQTLADSRTVALTGMGGMGKTQTAIEYVYRHRPGYRAVLWMQASSRDRLIAGYVDIARQLGVAGLDEQDPQVAIASLQHWFTTQPGWLLVIDNVDDLQLVREFLPPGNSGHMLLMTRVSATGSLARRIELSPMPAEEGALLLLRRAKLVGDRDSLNAVEPTAREIATAIAQALGGLPLALDQAGAFIEETPSSLGEYLDLYRNQGAQLLENQSHLTGDQPSIRITFSLAFQKVADRSPAASDLLHVCAFLAPDAIPEEVFIDGAEELGDRLSPLANQPLRLLQLITEAGRFSLIDRNPTTQTIRMHRLVQEVLKAELDETAHRLWAGRTIRAVNAAFPYVDYTNWPTCDRLLPHARLAARLIADYQYDSAAASRLLNQTAYYLVQQGRYGDAEPLYEQALELSKRLLGDDHPDIATSLNNLAELYRTQGRYGQAEPLYRQALELSQQQGNEHPAVATSLNNLAELYDLQGRPAAAETLYVQALALRRQFLEDNPPAVATSLNNLAMLYASQGRYGEAEPLYQEALDLRRQLLGPEHPSVATGLNNLALLYISQGRQAEAEALYQEALEMRKRLLGEEHPDVATILNNLAGLYDSLERYAEAEELYHQAIGLNRRVLGSEHPDVATSLNNLALLYDSQKRFEEAQPLYEEALEIAQRSLGPDHISTQTIQRNLEHLRRRQERA